MYSPGAQFLSGTFHCSPTVSGPHRLHGLTAGLTSTDDGRNSTPAGVPLTRCKASDAGGAIRGDFQACGSPHGIASHRATFSEPQRLHGTKRVYQCLQPRCRLLISILGPRWAASTISATPPHVAHLHCRQRNSGTAGTCVPSAPSINPAQVERGRGWTRPFHYVDPEAWGSEASDCRHCHVHAPENFIF